MVWRMKIHESSLDGVYIVETSSLADDRGMFSRLYCEHELSSVIGARHIVQINFSRTERIGAVRGLHYQRPPHAEMKLVRCIKGRVWDVSVDLRTGSRTFLKWHAEELSPDNAYIMVIPEGCAHGFQVLEKESELLYLHTSFYNPDAEAGIFCEDPCISIEWPLFITELSQRDRGHVPIGPDFSGVAV